jgi:hypothetical protein
VVRGLRALISKRALPTGRRLEPGRN